MAWTGPKAPPNDATVGTHVLVNGRYAPYLDVSATRYRLRLLNASPFSAYNFSLSDGRPFVQIGTGNGFLPEPVVRDTILLGPAQRADVIVDFHGETRAGTSCCRPCRATTARVAGRGTDAGGCADAVPRRRPAADPSRLPARLPSPGLAPAPKKVSRTWTFDLGGGEHHAPSGRSTAGPSTPTGSTTAPGSARSSGGGCATPAT